MPEPRSQVSRPPEAAARPPLPEETTLDLPRVPGPAQAAARRGLPEGEPATEGLGSEPADLIHERWEKTRQDRIAFEAELGVGGTSFLETLFEAEDGVPPELRACAARLGAEWSRLREGDLSPEAMTAWLLADYRETLDGARRRWDGRFGTGRFTVEAIGRAWVIGRQEELRFRIGSPGVTDLPDLPPPRGTDTRVATGLIEGSAEAPVAPLLAGFAEQLRHRYPGFLRMATYRGHGTGGFTGRGHSLDLFLRGLDDRGFYPEDTAVRLLHAVHEAATAVGARWRAVYNDFTVADAVNRALGRRYVVFGGTARRTGDTVIGLRWHGPAPLVLHLHLDLTPLDAGTVSI